VNERWRLSGDLDEGRVEDSDDIPDDVEPIEGEAVDPAQGPLESDLLDLGWEAEGLLTDNEPVDRGTQRTLYYVVAILLIIAMLAVPAFVIFVY
jgi:hypothetical protein